MNQNPMTVSRLKAALAQLGSGHDDRVIKAWLPGSYITLSDSVIIRGADVLLIEGNLDPGSALEADPNPGNVVEALIALRAAAQAVVDNWEHGDLAAAVRALATTLQE